MSNPAPQKQFTGKHMLVIMLVFFGTVIAVNMTLVYFSRVSWSGLVVQNSYVASQSFNEDTARLQAAAAMGLNDRLSYDKGKLVLTLQDASGLPVLASNVSMSLGLATTDREDRTLVLQRTGHGTYEVETALVPGVWNGTITATVEGKGAWERIIRLTVKG